MKNVSFHSQIVFNYFIYKVQIWDYIKKLSDEKKKSNVRKYDLNVIKIYYESKSMIMFY